MQSKAIVDRLYSVAKTAKTLLLRTNAGKVPPVTGVIPVLRTASSAH